MSLTCQEELKRLVPLLVRGKDSFNLHVKQDEPKQYIILRFIGKYEGQHIRLSLTSGCHVGYSILSQHRCNTSTRYMFVGVDGSSEGREVKIPGSNSYLWQDSKVKQVVR